MSLPVAPIRTSLPSSLNIQRYRQLGGRCRPSNVYGPHYGSRELVDGFAIWLLGGEGCGDLASGVGPISVGSVVGGARELGVEVGNLCLRVHLHRQRRLCSWVGAPAYL